MRPLLTEAQAATAIERAKAEAPRDCPPCTCALGRCLRSSHHPLPAGCGHPGVYGTTETGLTYCFRPDCFDSAGIASAIRALTRKTAPR